MLIIKQKVQVIMLPIKYGSKSKSKLGLYKKNLYYDPIISDHKGISPSNWFMQHLYIVSDDKIKEGDWYLDTQTKQIKQYLDTSRTCSENILWYCCKKIIATTDSSLIKTDCYYEGTGYDKRGVCQACSGKGFRYLTSRIPENFINKYIHQHNTGNTITDILVEYREKYDIRYQYIRGFGETAKRINHPNELVINQDNTINIHSIKTNWTKEDLFNEIESQYTCENQKAFLKSFIKEL